MGLKREALSAAMDNARRTSPRPPRMERLPRKAPLSRLNGASPARAATSFLDNVPSSGMAASKAEAVRAPHALDLDEPGNLGAQGRRAFHHLGDAGQELFNLAVE